MIKNYKILAIIPARGGSKSVPKKNIRNLLGKPLIAHTIEIAKKMEILDRVIVSTDDKKIAQISKEYGAEIPFIRPKELAEDNTPDLPVFQHAIHWLEKNEGYFPDIIVHLRPTSPFREKEHIKMAVEKLIDTNADSVRSVSLALQIPQKMWRIQKDDIMIPLLSSESEEIYNKPRQELEPVYWQNGIVDVVWRDVIMKKNSMTGKDIRALIIEQMYAIDIDTELDLIIAEAIMKYYNIK